MKDTAVSKVSKHGFFSGPSFPAFGPNFVNLRSKSPYLVRVQENTDRKKLHTWKFFMQWEIYKLTY